MARRVWTSVDFSGCTLTSGDQQVIVIVSLWIELSDELDIQNLDEQVFIFTHTGVYVVQQHSLSQGIMI